MLMKWIFMYLSEMLMVYCTTQFFLVFIFWMNAWFAFLIFKVCLEDFFAKNLCRVLVKSVLDGCAGRSLASPQSDTAVIVETPGTDQTIYTVQLFQNRTWHIFFHNVKVGPSSPQFWSFFLSLYSAGYGPAWNPCLLWTEWDQLKVFLH